MPYPDFRTATHDDVYHWTGVRQPPRPLIDEVDQRTRIAPAHGYQEAHGLFDDNGDVRVSQVADMVFPFEHLIPEIQLLLVQLVLCATELRRYGAQLQSEPFPDIDSAGRLCDPEVEEGDDGEPDGGVPQLVRQPVYDGGDDEGGDEKQNILAGEEAVGLLPALLSIGPGGGGGARRARGGRGAAHGEPSSFSQDCLPEWVIW